MIHRDVVVLFNGSPQYIIDADQGDAFLAKYNTGAGEGCWSVSRPLIHLEGDM